MITHEGSTLAACTVVAPIDPSINRVIAAATLRDQRDSPAMIFTRAGRTLGRRSRTRMNGEATGGRRRPRPVRPPPPSRGLLASTARQLAGAWENIRPILYLSNYTIPCLIGSPLDHPNEKQETTVCGGFLLTPPEHPRGEGGRGRGRGERRRRRRRRRLPRYACREAAARLSLLRNLTQPRYAKPPPTLLSPAAGSRSSRKRGIPRRAGRGASP